MFSRLTKFVSVILYPFASQSLIPISLLTVTLRLDESFLSEHSKKDIAAKP